MALLARRLVALLLLSRSCKQRTAPSLAQQLTLRRRYHFTARRRRRRRQYLATAGRTDRRRAAIAVGDSLTLAACPQMKRTERRTFSERM